MASTIDITGTRAGLAAILSGIFFSWGTWVLTAVACGLLIVYAEEGSHWAAAGLLAALLFASLFIIRRFITDRLGDDAHLAATARVPMDRLQIGRAHV